MADNPTVDNGALTDYVVATDDDGTAQVQWVKLKYGADGSFTAVDADNPLPVQVHRDVLRIAVDSGGLTTATTAYVAGDQLGTQFTLANAARASGGTGLILSVMVTSAADITGAMDVAFFRSSVTLAADNAAFAISDTDAKALVAYVPLTSAYDIGNNRIAYANNLAIPYDCSGGTSLFAAIITRLGHTFFAAVTDLQLQVFVARD